jgi:hypothetical protein
MTHYRPNQSCRRRFVLAGAGLAAAVMFASLPIPAAAQEAPDGQDGSSSIHRTEAL